MMIKAGIIGGAGYTGGELLRVLLRHPDVEIAFVHSTSHAGEPLHAAHSDLFGDTGLHFVDSLLPCDVLFLCMGHGKSIEFLKTNALPGRPAIIDLSQDFRNDPLFTAPDGGEMNFVYGLPEYCRDAIRSARYVANPGCFATAFQLALLPLAAAHKLTDEVQVHGITGSTGAGQALSATSHFSWRNGNISIYKPFTHQHLREVTRTLTPLAGDLPELNFVPVRGNFTRGIFLSAYTHTALSHEGLTALYKNYYASAAFTHLSDRDISMKEIVGTNKCLLRVEKIGNKALITSVIDNLLKGASGQAVQNMNLMFGLDEKAGLELKAIGF